MDTRVKAQVEHEREHERETHPDDTFLELGSVSKDTQGLVFGTTMDHGIGLRPPW